MRVAVGAAAGSVLLAASCASYDVRTAEFRAYYHEGEFAQAELVIDRLLGEPDEIDPSSGDTHLFFLEKAMTRLGQGDAGGATTLLRDARDQLEARSSMGWSEYVGTLLLDDTAIDYSGHDYELILVRGILAITDLLTGAGDAYAYALQVGEKQEEIIGSSFGEELGYKPQESYRRVALGAYLQGVIEEGALEPDEARLTYARAREYIDSSAVIDGASARERRPVIASSVRDILVAQHKPERNEEMLARVNRYFDHVLVHGDPNFIPFERTFPHARKIADKIHYTGYVVDRMGRSHGDSTAGRGEVIVSAGGGAVGLALLRDAIEARQLTSAAGRTWRVLVGVTVPEPEYREIAALDGDGVVVERARADFTTLLTNCDLSISQGGYNTLMEVLDAGTRAVIVPYAGGIETEQTLRAREMAKLGAVQVVNEDDLSPQAIASAADAALAGPPTSNAGLDTAGAEMTADLVSGWAGALDW
ncbi:MAG: hypothetical protein IH905_03130 [Proteobacteria bacterium]|nr:hypothetical protein [Pseudomonadota bacterium]